MTSKKRHAYLRTNDRPEPGSTRDASFRQGHPRLLTSAECEDDEHRERGEGALDSFGERMRDRTEHRRAARGGGWIEDAFGDFLSSSAEYKAKGKSRPSRAAESRAPDESEPESPPANQPAKG